MQTLQFIANMSSITNPSEPFDLINISETFDVQDENIPVVSEACDFSEHANTTHLLNIWQAIQKGCCVLRVTWVILTTVCCHSQGIFHHGIQHCFIELLGYQGRGQLSQIIL